jgi:DnaK suppressor protein
VRVEPFEFTSNGGGEEALPRLIKRRNATFYEVISLRAMLTKKKKEDFKKLLTGRLNELLKEANKTVSGMTDQRDRATMESDRNFTLRIRDRERKLIAKIRDALDRIEEGTFGICEECGEDISAERLEARPVTTLCIECKKKQENDEKARGI